MSTLSKDLDDMLRIRQYLQEAQDWAKESDIPPYPTGSDSVNSVTPASVVPLIEASAKQADAVISSLSERLENPRAE